MDKTPKEETELSPLQGMFFWWGRLAAHSGKKGSFPSRAAHFIAFIAPKLRRMNFGIDLQQNLLSCFLKGIYKVFWREAAEELDLDE